MEIYTGGVSKHHDNKLSQYSVFIKWQNHSESTQNFLVNFVNFLKVKWMVLFCISPEKSYFKLSKTEE